ncbi:hypothetical protein EYF80_015345 [Liparis tanakae]|uniref:Uncharacterized protein n=1 Tax=Liparis tanakae TaxID=230148 RepID=A0A4Z2I8N7_9TELE|nr:hypothetical protein EYF80_015345 [Liparis tanakae]
MRSLLICSTASSSGSGGRACSRDKRMACKNLTLPRSIIKSGQQIILQFVSRSNITTGAARLTTESKQTTGGGGKEVHPTAAQLYAKIPEGGPLIELQPYLIFDVLLLLCCEDFHCSH